MILGPRLLKHIALTLLTLLIPAAPLVAEHTSSIPYEISLNTLLEHDDGTFLWFHPRAAAIPSSGTDRPPEVIITLQKHLQVSDFYSGLYMMYSKDLGKTWSGPTEIPELAWRDGPDDTIRAVCDVTPGYHEPTGKVLAIGAQLYYKRDGSQFASLHRANQTAYAVYDPVAGIWSGWRELKMPAEPKFDFSRCACAQWSVESDGRLLLPLYFGINDQVDASVTVASCTFDGKELSYVEHGTEMTIAGGRGLCEPSLARFKDRYFLTLRNDTCGYVTSSADGLHFDSIRPWCFDDGTELGSYNTQQHWITHPKGLFLAYTRRGANNDHVFRHRAPLFLGQVNPDTLQVIRATERVVIPERGATLGNFGASRINACEFWVTVGEGIWNDEIRARGAKGALYLARIAWE